MRKEKETESVASASETSIRRKFAQMARGDRQTKLGSTWSNRGTAFFAHSFGVLKKRLLCQKKVYFKAGE